MYLFSIIIPLYNKSMYVKRALESIESQTLTDYEVIIVDDGSTDDSVSVVKEYLKDGWKLYQQENAGVSSARNKGAELSNGKYLCFLDADDAWHPQFLECMKYVIETMPNAGLYGANYRAFLSENTQKSEKRIDCTKISCKEINLFKKWLVRNPLNTDGMVIPKQLFESIGGFDVTQRYYEDATLMFKIAVDYPVVVTSQILTYYFTEVADNANSRMKKELPLYPGYLPTLLDLCKTHKEVWLHSFTKMELFLVLASNLYFHNIYRNQDIADKLQLDKNSWYYFTFVQYCNSYLSYMLAVILLKFRSLLLRILRPFYT